MDMIFPSATLWWISAVDIPVAAILFRMIWRTKKDCNDTVDRLHRLLETRHSQLRDSLAAYKLEVAKSYAAVNDVRELESRLVAHLLRIESKLDKTALKTEAMIHHFPKEK